MRLGVDRARLMIRRDGLLGALRRILRRALACVLLAEDHTWLVLDLQVPRHAVSAVDGLAVRRVGADEDSLLDQLTTVVAREARRRLTEGHELWIALRQGRLVANMWLFHGSTPAIAAPRGELQLPDDTACLEDVEVLRFARGIGVAPAVYSAIADAAADRGLHWIVVKTTVDNSAALHAMQKVGFEPVATMSYRRVGRRARTLVRPTGNAASPMFMLCIAPGLEPDEGSSPGKDEAQGS